MRSSLRPLRLVNPHIYPHTLVCSAFPLWPRHLSLSVRVCLLSLSFSLSLTCTQVLREIFHPQQYKWNPLQRKLCPQWELVKCGGSGVWGECVGELHVVCHRGRERERVERDGREGTTFSQPISLYEVLSCLNMWKLSLSPSLSLSFFIAPKKVPQ